jgi:hypothetical protein
MLTRDAILAAAGPALDSMSAVRAAWVGGSEATGRMDQYSDIDLVALAADDAVEDVFAVLESTLTELSPIEHKLRIPQTPWPGLEQVIYRLRDAGPHLLVDFAVIKLSTPPSGRFQERERHGSPRILFDRDGLLEPVALDLAAQGAKMAAKLADLRTRFPLFQTLVLRAIERGQPVDAIHFYMNFTLRPVIDLLRIAHCPERFDFGPRYLDLDLPAGAAAAVRRLSYSPELEALRAHMREAESLFNETLLALDATRRFS